MSIALANGRTTSRIRTTVRVRGRQHHLGYVCVDIKWAAFGDAHESKCRCSPAALGLRQVNRCGQVGVDRCTILPSSYCDLFLSHRRSRPSKHDGGTIQIQSRSDCAQKISPFP